MRDLTKRSLGLVALSLCLLMAQAEAKAPKLLDVTDTVAANRIMTRFAAIIQAADLGTFLSSKGPFTVFVPTDSAFARMPPEMFEMLLRPENKERLQHILLFHVINGKKYTAKDLLTVPSLLSCEGNPIPVKTTKSGAQMVLKAKITHADIRCLNGVIDQIDTVLMPPETSLPPLVTTPPPPPPPPPAPPPPPPVAKPDLVPTPVPVKTPPVVPPAPATTNAMASPVAPGSKPPVAKVPSATTTKSPPTAEKKTPATDTKKTPSKAPSSSSKNTSSMAVKKTLPPTSTNAPSATKPTP